MKNRLRELRGDMTLEQLGNLVGTNASQIHKLESGKRQLTVKWAKKIAAHLGCSYLDLLQDPDDTTSSVPIIGTIGEHEEFTAFADVDESSIRPPHIVQATAIRVTGHAMWPVYRDGDLLYFDQISGIHNEAIGADCVVKVRNGPIYVKRLLRGTRAGRFRLASYKAPDLDDVDIEWAAPILWIQRAVSNG